MSLIQGRFEKVFDFVPALAGNGGQFPVDDAADDRGASGLDQPCQ